MPHLLESVTRDNVRGKFQNDFQTEEEALHACIRDNKLLQLRQLLEQAVPADLYEHKWVGMPLQFAACCGDIDAVNLLLDYGADPRYQGGTYYQTAITSAATQGHVAAAENGHLSVVAKFLNWWDHWPTKVKEEALVAAAEQWQLPVVEYLLKHGNMSFSTRSPILSSALAYAARRRDLLVLEATPYGDAADCTALSPLIALLVDAGADPNAHECGTPVLLTLATDIELADATETLLNQQADPNKKGFRGWSVLHFMTSKHGSNWRRLCTPRINEKVIRLLLGRGGSVLQLDHAGESPLHFAAFSLSLPMFHTYVASIPPNDRRNALYGKSRQGETLLHYAAAGCNLEVVSFLISLELDVNERNSNNWTPLMCALTPVDSPSAKLRQWIPYSFTKVIQTARYLLGHGADPLIATDEAWNPLHALSLHFKDDMNSEEATSLARDLTSCGVDPSAPAPLLTLKTARPITRLPVPWGYRLREFMCQIYEAVEKPKHPITEQVFIKPGMPPLIWAAERGAIGVVKALIEGGVDPTLPGPDGMYPAQVAARSILRTVVPERFDKIARIFGDYGSGL